jgi:hypothetical protein
VARNRVTGTIFELLFEGMAFGLIFFNFDNILLSTYFVRYFYQPGIYDIACLDGPACLSLFRHAYITTIDLYSVHQNVLTTCTSRWL